MQPNRGTKKLRGPKWHVFAESVRGTSHRRSGTEGQDANSWRVHKPTGCLAAAIADGAGSSKFGGVAAQIAADTAVESLLASLGESGKKQLRKILRGALADSRRALEQEAQRRGCSLADLSTTLIVLLSTSQLSAVGQVGDGFALLADSDHQVIGHTEPQTGEFANETVFLTSGDALDNASLSVWKGKVEAVAVLTDGLQRLAMEMPRKLPYAPFFTSLFRAGSSTGDFADRQLSQFLRSPRLQSRTDDDVTLLVAWRRLPGQASESSRRKKLPQRAPVQRREAEVPVRAPVPRRTRRRRTAPTTSWWGQLVESLRSWTRR